MKNALVVATVTVILLVGSACRGHDYNLIRANRWNSPSDMRTWEQVRGSMTSSPEVWYVGLGLTDLSHHRAVAQGDRARSNRRLSQG